MRDVVIIGSRPAGLTAALYTARANLKPLLVENYPGFRGGIMGPELMGEMRAQAERFGTEFVKGDVSSVTVNRSPFFITTTEERYESRTLIIATGASARLLGISSERSLMGHGVSTCATCDGYFFRDKPIVVVGGGDSAMEEATFLTKFASHVTVVHRRDTLRASKIMQEKAFKNSKISFEWDSEIEEINDVKKGVVTSVTLKNVNTGSRKALDVEGVFIAIGHNPNTSLFKDKVELDENGYIEPHSGTRTSVPGVFAAGDVQDHVYRQAVTAAGTGCMAAIDAERYLEQL